jgi:hypothetical protein
MSVQAMDAIGINPTSDKEGITMPSVELVKMERGLRGKGNEGKKVAYEGISETAARPDNPVDAAMQLVSNDLQNFWDRFVLGYNEYAYEAVADPIAKYLNPEWDADKTKNFRLTVNAMSKLTGKDKDDVAEELVKVLG